MRARAGVFDVCHMAEFRVFGFGAFDFLQRLLTNDLRRISEWAGAIHPVAATTKAASRRPHRLSRRGHRVPHRRQRVEPRDRLAVGVSPRRENWSSRTFRIGRGSSPSRAPKHAGLGELAGKDWAASRPLHIRDAIIDATVPALVARTGYTGEDGVEILCRAADAPAIWRVLLSFPEVTACRTWRQRYAAARDGISPPRERHGWLDRSDRRRAWMGRLRGQGRLRWQQRRSRGARARARAPAWSS